MEPRRQMDEARRRRGMGGEVERNVIVPQQEVWAAAWLPLWRWPRLVWIVLMRAVNRSFTINLQPGIDKETELYLR